MNWPRPEKSLVEGGSTVRYLWVFIDGQCRLTQDLICEKHPDLPLSSLNTLDLVQCGLKTVDLSPVEAFDNLARQVVLYPIFFILPSFPHDTVYPPPPPFKDCVRR